MKRGSKLIKALYNLVLVMAVITVNSTCCHHFYQEKMDSELDSLKKYHEE